LGETNETDYRNSGTDKVLYLRKEHLESENGKRNDLRRMLWAKAQRKSGLSETAQGNSLSMNSER
jgi:hypothetical protein